MRKYVFISSSLILVTIALAVLSYIVLPENVITQISGNGNDTYMPKILAVILPSALGIIGSLFGLCASDDKSRNKGYLVSGVGVAVLVIMLVVNIF